MNLSSKPTSADSASICDAEFQEFEPWFPLVALLWAVVAFVMGLAGLLVL